MSQGAELTIVDPTGQRRRMVVRPGERVVLGRGREVEALIEDLGVSRQHVAFEMHGDGFFVRDLGSRNGTFLGADRLEPDHATQLDDGDEVRLGHHSVHVRLDGVSGSRRVPRPKVPFLPEEEFELLGELGSGGASTVWAARQRLLGRRVAIKALNACVDPSMDAHQRFLREARLLTQVKSPFVLELYDIRIHEGHPFLILELVDGPTAKGRVAAGPVPIAEALKIAEDVAQALVALGAIGIVHRDVKPSNVLLTPEGAAKLSDFGLAKGLDTSALTKSDLGLGSLPYVSPEQALGARDVDARSDIYGLGATLYHLICGRPPFVFEKDQGILQRVERVEREEPTPPRALRRDCPEGVERLVLRMLRKDPAARPQDPAHLVGALRALRTSHYPDWCQRPREERHDTAAF